MTIKDKAFDWWLNLDLKQCENLEHKYHHYGHNMGITIDDIIEMYKYEHSMTLNKNSISLKDYAKYSDMINNKKIKIQLNNIKSEEWSNIIQGFNLSREKYEKYFEYGEFASIEIEVDENLNIVAGKIISIK